MRPLPKGAGALAALALVIGCAGWPPWRDAPRVTVVGVEPLPSEGMEIRFALVLRVQNPDDDPIDYDGIALELDLNGRSFASGVSDASGRIPRYGETVVTVPVTISAFALVRQFTGLVEGGAVESFPYELRGKLGGGWFAVRFRDEGRLALPEHPEASRSDAFRAHVASRSGERERRRTSSPASRIRPTSPAPAGSGSGM